MALGPTHTPQHTDGSPVSTAHRDIPLVEFQNLRFLPVTQVIAVMAPMIIFTVVYFQRRNVYDLHHAILGTSFSP
jgi:hypothetical protein